LEDALKISKTKLTFAIPIALFILALAVYIFTQPIKSTKSTGATVKAPDFSYTFLNEKPAKLSDYLGKKPIVLNFWSPG